MSKALRQSALDSTCFPSHDMTSATEVLHMNAKDFKHLLVRLIVHGRGSTDTS